VSETSQTTRLRLVLLTLGATAGLILAASGLVESWSPSSGSLPATAIARVGERVIPQERYMELVSDLAADKRTPLNADDRLFALDRLIDEELLIMRGIELGLHESAPEIRKAIAATVIAQIAAEAEATMPDEAILRRFYETNSQYFTTTARYRLQWWRVPGSGADSERKAATAYEQLSKSMPTEAVMLSTGLQTEALLPDQMLPLSKLSDYLGPGLAQQATELEPGEFSRPIAAGGSFHILYLLARQEGVLPAFEQARPMVEAEYLRRSGDEALRQYLAWLRERAEIIVVAEKHQ
jgi:hypothetical protein